MHKHGDVQLLLTVSLPCFKYSKVTFLERSIDSSMNGIRRGTAFDQNSCSAAHGMQVLTLNDNVIGCYFMYIDVPVEIAITTKQCKNQFLRKEPVTPSEQRPGFCYPPFGMGILALAR